jgi:hypothetical protein
VTSFQINNNVLVYDLYNPGQVSEVGFFKLVELPQNQSGVLYYSIYPFQDLQATISLIFNIIFIIYSQ